MAILVNKLYGKTSSMTSLSQAIAVYKGGTKVYKIYAGSELVWHESDEEEDDTQTTQYGIPTVTDVQYSDVSANGVGGAVTISWQLVKNTYDSSNQLTGSETITGSSVASTVGGTTVISGSGYSSGQLYAPDCDTTETSRRLVFTINMITYVANGVTASISETYNVYQEANVIEYSQSIGDEVSLSLSGDTDTTVSVNGGTKTVTVEATGGQSLITYTSGATETISVDAVVSLSLSAFGASIDKTSITGSGVATVTFDANDSTATNRATVTATVGSLTKTITFEQDASSYSLTQHSLVNNVSASGGTASFTVQSTKNDGAYALSKSNVSVLGITDASVSSVTQQDDPTLYSIAVSLPENTSTESRTATVTVTQPLPSIETLTVTITQNAASSGGGGITSGITISGTNNSGIVSYNMTVSSGSYDEVEIRASDTKSATSGTVYASVTKTDVSSGTYTGTLRINSTATNVWLLVIYNGSIVASSLALTSSGDIEIIG